MLSVVLLGDFFFFKTIQPHYVSPAQWDDQGEKSEADVEGKKATHEQDGPMVGKETRKKKIKK